MAKKKQRINLIDRNGNSQVVQVNSSDLSNSTKDTKKASLGNVVKNTVSGIVKGGNTKATSDERNYGPLTSVARTVTGGVTSAKDKQGHNLIDNTKQVGKNLVSGAFSGVTSIPDSELYEVRNSLEKGEKKAEETTGVRDTLKSLFGTGKDALLSSNPITAQFVKDDDDSKGVEGALKGLKNVSDISGGKKGLYKSIEAFGEAYSDYKKSKGKEGKLSEKVEKIQEKIDKPAEEYAQKVQEENQKYSKPVQVLGENFQTVGNMVPSMAMSIATKNPSAGMWALYQGAKGSATKEALQKGADLDTATAIGNAKGLIEVGTEQLSGGIKFKGKSVYGQGALDDVIKKNVNRLVKNKAANWLVKQFGTAPLGEIAEETISDLAGHFIDKNTVDPNDKYTLKDWGKTVGMTYLSTLTLNLLGGSFGKSSYNQNLQNMAETQVADIQNRVDRGLMSQEDGARAIEQITQELNDSIGTNEEISTPEEIQELLANTSPEDIQQAVASAANAVAKQIEQGKINEQQGQQLLTTIQENAQNLLEQQQSMQNESTTIDNKIQLVQQLNDTERAALTEITQKLKRGEQLNEQDRATLQYLNSKGTPQTVENAPISNETTQSSAIPQETQNVAQTDKNEVLKLGETDAKSYGDLGKGRDTTFARATGSRSTGHFGTGAYFVTEDYQPGKLSSYNDRPISRANLSDYNLYKPLTDRDGYDLHDGLRAINSRKLFNKKQVQELQESFNTYKRQLSDESVNKLIDVLEKQGYDVENIKEDFQTGWTTRAENNLVDMAEGIIDDYDRLYREYNTMIEQIKRTNPKITDETIEKAFEATNKQFEEYMKKGYEEDLASNVDSLSTIFMKNLGYEGVDVRHLEGLNNTTYGTVVYDLKHNEKERNALNREQEKININTIKATIAPYYDTPLTKENYNEIKDAVDTTFRETANNLVTLLGGKIKDTTNNIGGFTFSEGENAGNWVKELSYTFELENMSKEDGMLFSSLMGDLAYEQQEAVISSTYENDLNNSNALEFRLKYQDIDKVMDALDKLGIHDYTIDTKNKTLNLLEFDLEKPYDTVQKITDMVQELGGNEADAKFTGIQSEYIDKDVRKGIYETWLKANEGRKENRELYSLVKEAYKKIGGTSDSSFSNENVKVINNKPTITNKEAYNSKPREGTIRLYTNTSAENIDSILKNGLDISKAKQNEYEGNMTWFETRPNLKGYGGTTIAVDVPSNLSMDKVNDTQYTVYDNISPENIVFVDRPVMNNYRTSDIEDLVSKYGEEKVRSVFDRAVENGNNSISREEFNDLLDSIDKKAVNENVADKVEDNVITIKNDDLKDTPKDQIKTEDTGIKIGDKPVKMEIPIDSKKNKIGQYVPKDGFTQKELKDGKIGDSKFYRNVTERADFINDEVRKTVKDDDNIKHYRKVTNEESMQEAFDDLNTRGTEAIADFFNNDKELTSKDTAMGWLLIEQSQANGDYNFANQVLRKMRDNATKTGQTMQMYNYYARLTPEGMYKWCGDQLLRAEEIFEKGKTKKWIEQNKDRWQLNGEEVEFINKQMERVQELNKMNDNDKTTIEIGKKRKK